MRVGERAKVVRLNRPTPGKPEGERDRWVDQVGVVMRRLNVAWEPEHGELWEIRFDDGEHVVFSSSELALVHADGREESLDAEMEAMREGWGQAPRTPSLPFKRFGAGLGAAPAVLAVLVFALAGVLLLWAGVADENWLFGAAGALLVLVGIGAAGVLVR